MHATSKPHPPGGRHTGYSNPLSEPEAPGIDGGQGKETVGPLLLELIAAGAFISGGLSLLYLPGTGFGDNFEAVQIARALAAGDGYANPYGGYPTGPTAHLPPLFPLLLAGLFWLFGPTPEAGAVASSLCVAAHLLHTVLLVPIAALLVRSRRAGAWAALLAVVTPPLLVLPQWEAIYAGAGLMLFCLASHRWTAARGLCAGVAARCGAFAGALALLNAITPLVTGLWLLWLSERIAVSVAVKAKFLTLTAAFAGVTVAPWIVRNWLVLGAPVPLRSNFGLELALSNNEWAGPSQLGNWRRPEVARLHPTLSAEAREEMRREGEIAYNRRKLAEALEWIGQNKVAFLKLTGARLVQFWWPVDEMSGFHIFTVRLVTVLGLAGMIVMIVRREPAAWFLIGASLLFSLPYYLIHVTTRLRFPIMWVSLLGGGYFLEWAARRLVRLYRAGAL